MTKEEVLVILNKRIWEIQRTPYDTTNKPRGQVSGDLFELAGELETLLWVCQLVRQIEIPESVAPSPVNEQNSVATGWQAAVTGELKQKR